MDEDLNTIEGTARADFLRGSWQNDLILAGAGNDLIFARAGNDIVDAGDGNDRVFAGAGDDLVKTGLGRDFADGGRGVDTAQFDGDSSDYRIINFFGLTFVTDLRNGETDTLTRFEFLKFDDGLFDINGNPVDTNDDPEAVDDTAITNEDTFISIDVLGNDSDPDGDPLTVTEATAANGTVVINTDGTLGYTPGENFSGQDTISYTISDGNGGTSSASVKVQVGGVADDPILLLPNSLATIDLAPISLDDIDASLMDTDGSESLTVRFRGLPQDTAIAKAVVFEKLDQVRSLDDEIEVLDRLIQEADTELDALVAAITEAQQNSNTPPQVLEELEFLKGQVETERAEAKASKAEKEAARAELAAEVDALTKTADANGTIEIEDFGDGYVLLLPKGTVDNFEIKVDAIATESAPLAGPDFETATVSLPLQILVRETLAPQDDAATTEEDTPVTIFATANDVGEQPRVITVGDPDNGSVVIDDNGDLLYTPDANFSGVDTFDYRVADNFGISQTATVQVTVGGVPDEPTLEVPDSLSTTDLALIKLDDINASLVDTDQSESLKVKFGGLPPGAVISNPALVGGINGRIEVVESDIARIDASKRAKETELLNADQRINEIRSNPNPSPELLDELAGLQQRKEALTVELQQLDDQRAENVALREGLQSDLEKVSQTAGDDGHVEFDDFGDGFFLQLPDGTTDDFKLIVEAIATESEPLADPDTDTATATREIDVSVQESLEAMDDTIATREDAAVTIAATANDSDSDGDPLTIVDTTLPGNGSVEIVGTGDILYTPNADFSGEDQFKYTVQDPDGNQSTATVRVLVNGVADIPGLVVPESLETVDLADISLDGIQGVLADDDDSETLLIRLSNVPDGSVVTNPGAIADREAEKDALGASVKLLEIEIGSKQQQVAVKQREREELLRSNAPQEEIDAKQGEIDELNQLISDHTDEIGSANARIGELVSEIATFTIEPFSKLGNIIVYLGSFNGWILRPAPDTTEDFAIGVEALAIESEPVLNEDDRQAVSERANVGIQVLESATNEDPVAADDFVEAGTGVTVNIDVLGNDFDLDGDDLAIDSVSRAPINGQATVRVDRTIDYESAPGFVGTDSFEYTISDGNGGEATATVTVQVDPANSAPEGAPVVDGIPEVDQTLTANIDNISDADGLGPFAYQWERFIGGDISQDSSWNPIPGANAASFTPDSDFEGQTLRVRVFYTDLGNTFETLVSPPIELVEQENRDPVANDDSVSIDEGLAVSIDVLSNDLDPDSDPLTISSVDDPANGSAIIGRVLGGGEDELLYRPDAGFVGTDIFTYEISDGNGGTDTATVTVTVTEDGTSPDDDGDGPPVVVPPIFTDPPDDGGGGKDDGGGKIPPGGGLNPTPIFPTPIDPGLDGSLSPYDGVLTGTPFSDVFLFNRDDGAINVLGFQQATGTAGEAADQIQLSGFGLAFADLDSNGDGQVATDDADVSGGGTAPLVLDFGGGDALSVSGVSFLTEDDLLFV